MSLRYLKKNRSDKTYHVGVSLLKSNLSNIDMNNGIFTLSWNNIRSAIVYALLTIIVAFALAILQSIISAGSIFGINWKMVVDHATIAVIPLLIAGLSLLKNLLTTNNGSFLGITKVVEPTI